MKKVEEVRPGEMLVQKREDGDSNGGVGGGSGSPMINIKVCHGSNHYHLHFPVQSTFGGSDSKTTASSSTSSPMEDSNSPYFLHSADHPGFVLVSQNLTGPNYNSWSRFTQMALTAKNKIGFIDGSIPRPATEDPLYSTWIRCDSMVTSWILNSVAKDIAYSLLDISTAAKIWHDLRDRFHQSNGPKIFQVKKQLTALNQSSMDVSTYYTKLKILWNELKDFQRLPDCHCGAMRVWLSYQQEECVIQFLMGLNESYAQIRAEILMMEPLPSIAEVFSLVVQEERQRQIGMGLTSSPDSMGLSDLPPTIAASVRNLNQKTQKDRPICSHCGIQGHAVEKCYKIQGYPPRYKFKPRYQQTKAQTNQVSSTDALSTQDSLSTPSSAQGKLVGVLGSEPRASIEAIFNADEAWNSFLLQDKISKAAHKAVAEVRAEIDKLSGKVGALEATMNCGTVEEKEFAILTELLMRQLLKLDSIEAEGEAKVQRRAEVRRVQSLVEKVDTLKARNSNPVSTGSNAASVTTK